MFEQSANQQLMQKLTLYCMYIEHNDRWIPAVVLTEEYAVTAFHNIPDRFRELGLSVTLCDAIGQHHEVHIHGVHSISNYVVFKRNTGNFVNVPDIVYPMLLDQYIVMGFSFVDKTPSVKTGHISSMSTGRQQFFYGDAGRLSGSGGGVFYRRNGALIGIAKEMISAQVIYGHIEVRDYKPFSV
ncbi:unnamed protein product [Auanema sp. JU1783]|nr:unnamed protein product [Auanema sp. JU1783]